MVPQLRRQNQNFSPPDGEWFRLERTWQALLEQDPQVRIEIEIDVVYNSNNSSLVPDRIDVRYSVDGGDAELESFDNV